MPGDIGNFLIDLIIKPGSSLQLIPVINVAVILLLGLLFALSYSKIAVIHLIIMGILSLGLLISVNWFYYEYQKVINTTDNDTIKGSTKEIHPNIEKKES